MSRKLRGVDKTVVLRPLRGFCPDYVCGVLHEVSPDTLVAEGVKLILLDVDNTLLPWRGATFPQETLDWLERARSLGLGLCIISNTRHPERLYRLAKQIDVPVVLGPAKKPSPKPYLKAIGDFGFSPNEVVMIGDQVFTDIWGANRAGIRGILLLPEGAPDFITTRLLLRPVERLLLRHIDRVKGLAPQLEND